jgi:N-acetylmuramic acid 6-phosphate etherase
MSIGSLIRHINDEDKTVPYAIEKVLDKIETLAAAASGKMKAGGRMFYVGAGTSGRLGIVDASECPPTFGIEQGRVIGLIAGGDSAIRKAVEFAEDDPEAGWKDLQQYSVSPDDIVIGIAASGTTPYVVGALKHCRERELLPVPLYVIPARLLPQKPIILWKWSSDLNLLPAAHG